jgi:DNA gyrase subunit A
MDNKTEHGFIKPAQLEDEMRTSYMEYAMSVIVARALPDVRDGLKPVQRRILYAMNDLGMRPNAAYKKSARLVGEVLGKWHPHGDSPVYDALVRMAQPFSLRLPLVDGQGNFGSVDNDPPAAMRYTEARLSQAATEILANLDQDTVDFIDNFDGTLREPVVLPARLPNLLINGASGIAVGMATNIPPQNATEVCNGVLALIENPDATSEDLMRHVRGPDFPTGATIMGREGIRSVYTTGRGQMVVRAVAEIEQPKSSGRMQIIVSELPYQVNKAALIEKIATLVKTKRLEGISDIRDESNRQGMRIVIELRSGAQGLIVLNNLYKLTAMQSTFSANMLALVGGSPKVITLKSALQHYIDFRREVVTRRAQFELKRAQQRAHILEGLKIALDNLDSIIALIRGAADADAAKKGLMEWYDLDDVQAQAILDMQLRRIAALERERIETEYQELRATIKELEELLADPAKVSAEVAGETEELKKKVRGARRTTIQAEVQDFRREDLEAHEQVVVTLSQGGYIKRILAGTYRNQHRGGKGVYSMRTKEDDPVRHILVGDTHDTLLFFTNTGRVLSSKSYELRADISRNTRGVPIANVIPLSDKEHINSIIGVSSLQEEGLFLVLVTRRGSIKRVALEQISKIRRSGLIIMNLKPGDELVTARLAREEDDLIMVTEQGMSIRFPVSDITARQRAAGGVRAMTLAKKDRIMAMDIVVLNSKLLVIGKQGYGKLTDLNRYRRQGRGGSGIKTLSITKKTGTLAAAEVIADSDEVYVVSRKALVLRTNLSEIRSTGRATQGVTIFKLDRDDAVSAIACVRELEVPKADRVLPDLKAKAKSNGKPNGRVSPKDLK